MFHVYRVFTYNPPLLGGICVFCMHFLRQSCFLEVICMHFYVRSHHLNSTGHHSYAFLRGVHSPGRHFYAFLREACSSELPWGPFVCIFMCQPANPACQPSQPAQPANSASQPSQPTQPASSPTHPASQHLYAFLHGVHSPGLPWEPFVCIFKCTKYTVVAPQSLQCYVKHVQSAQL